MQSGDVLSVACFIAVLSVDVLGAIMPSVVMLNSWCLWTRFCSSLVRLPMSKTYSLVEHLLGSMKSPSMYLPYR